MWKGKGRSGIGDTNIQGTWEDWDGLSPNGRQYKSAITQETRNLSGADYWHARKADYPKQEPETWIKGKANIAAFREAEPVKQQKPKRSIASKILPQYYTLERLDVQQKELDKEHEAGNIDHEEYAELCYALNVKKERTVKSLNKALGIVDTPTPVGYDGLEENVDSSPVLTSARGDYNDVSGQCRKSWSEDIEKMLLWSSLGAIFLLWLCN